MAKKEKLIPIEDYVHIGKRGFPVNLTYKYRLIQRDKEGISPAPFKYIQTKDKGKAGNTKVMVVVTED